MTPWILLRGLTRDARHWGAFPDQLRAALPDATVIALDLPGNGSLWRQRSPANVPDMVECYRLALGELGIAPPYRLLALSLGAMAAVDWAHRHPLELTGMVLINTSLRPFHPLHWRLRPGAWAEVLRIASVGQDATRREQEVFDLTSRREPPPGLIADWARWYREHPVSLGNALRQILAAARYRAPGVPPAMATLLLAGEGDRLVDCRCSRQLASHWQVPLLTHATAGHDLPFDEGDWVATQIAAWLAASPSPGCSKIAAFPPPPAPTP